MRSFNILLHDFNTNKSCNHDIMPFLLDTYKTCIRTKFWWMCQDTNNPPVSFKDMIHFVSYVCKSRYWARCEYEWLMLGWPPGNTDTLEKCQAIINSSEKIDAWEQISMNIEVVTSVFIENLKELEN